MAEFLWTFAVQEVLKNVVKVAAEQIGLAWGWEEELSKLRKWLLKAEAILRDINTRKLHHDSVRMWVEDLQLLVYQADDLLDEIVYEGLRQKVQTAKIKKVRNFVSPSNNAFIFRLKMANKMKNVMDLLCKHYSEASPLGLVGNDSVEQEIDIISQFRETVSELEDHVVVGRDVEVESIVKQVIDASNQQVSSILPIVGMGGLGKTTLAKLVFNHEMITKHFDKTIWVCVSEPFVVNKILGEILQNLKETSLNGGDKKEVLLRELRKEMHGQRYFLVLDDVWNENAYLWDELKYCLTKITEQSENSIIVTTRGDDVAKIMGTLPSHHLSKLSEDQCWSLFKESASAYGLPTTSSLKVIRKKVIKKIGGLPLVARVLGRAVKFEGDDERWVQILENVVSNSLPKEDLVSSILKLSVDRLPSSSLKRCFAYCSNFPKDFVFEKDELVQMWMAQGFIQPQEERSGIKMEDIGDMYLNILFSRGLFQDAVKDSRGRIARCKMHDLIHDISCDVSNDQKFQLDSNPKHWMNRSKDVANTLRTIVIHEYIPYNIRKMFYGKLVINFACLRVLKMNESSYELPHSIGRLKHLRYLEISSSHLRPQLPKSINELYHLQTLKIRNKWIQYLPNNLSEFISLRYLKFSTRVKKTPSYLSQLTQLQTLSGFVVGVEKGCSITELGPLESLKGSLTISRLEKVRSKDEARMAKLVDKENLNRLHFIWSCDKRKDNNRNDLEVLEGLQPHKNLLSLYVKGFDGKYLANKTFVENLVVIDLLYCRNCERLPMLGQLNNLKELQIHGLRSARSIGNEFYGNDSNQRTFFPKLERFKLSSMKNLKHWKEITTSASKVTAFPHLQDLEIYDCTKLLNIPDIFGCCDENGVKHLTYVKITGCGQLTTLPNEVERVYEASLYVKKYRL